MSGQPLLRRSVHTEQALRSERPRLRGVLHGIAAPLMWPTATIWVWRTPSGTPRLAVAFFAVGIAIMLTFSALLHARRWHGHVHERLLRLDHCGIYAAIAGTGAAVALLGYSGPLRVAVLTAIGGGALLGIAVEWTPTAAPRGVHNAVYLTLGWVPVVTLPWLWRSSGGVVVGLLVAGGLLYTVGAVVVGLRRPDPVPNWFGYHELFHALVIAAIGLHATVVQRLVALVS